MEKTNLTTEEKRKARIAELEAKLQKAKAQDKAAAQKAEAKTYIPVGKKVLETLKDSGYRKSPEIAAAFAPKAAALGVLFLDYFRSASPSDRAAWISKAEALKNSVASAVLKEAVAQYEGQEKQQGEPSKNGAPQW